MIQQDTTEQDQGQIQYSATTPETLRLQNVDNSGSFWDSLDVLGTMIVAIIAIGAQIWFNKLVLKQASETLREGQRREKREQLLIKLNEFYGPMEILLNESLLLTQLFKQDRRFRTLTDLLEGKTFSGNDEVLLRQIMAVTKRIKKLILTKSGLVEEGEENLLSLMSKARAHYDILRLAYKGELLGEKERFSEIVYPRELDEAIKRKKRELELELEELYTEST